MSADKVHERIWLRPDMWDGEKILCWCQDIAPFIDDNPEDAIGPYIHADSLRKIVEKLESAEGSTQTEWELGVNWAKKLIKDLLEEK